MVVTVVVVAAVVLGVLVVVASVVEVVRVVGVIVAVLMDVDDAVVLVVVVVVVVDSDIMLAVRFSKVAFSMISKRDIWCAWFDNVVRTSIPLTKMESPTMLTLLPEVIKRLDLPSNPMNKALERSMPIRTSEINKSEANLDMRSIARLQLNAALLLREGCVRLLTCWMQGGKKTHGRLLSGQSMERKSGILTVGGRVACGCERRQWEGAEMCL